MGTPPGRRRSAPHPPERLPTVPLAAPSGLPPVSDATERTEGLVAAARRYADAHRDDHHVDVRPRLALAVVTCMDSRIDLFGLLGLDIGDAHVLRNAGGVVTDDMIRSLVVSQRALGTTEIVLVHHTDCGMQKVSDDSFKADLEAETGQRPTWALESFTDPVADVRQSMARIRSSPFVPHRDFVRGFVYDVDTCELVEVDAPPPG
ncbi:MAG: beta-class carbonic anhydrase [Acidimicrobiales bacterium]